MRLGIVAGPPLTDNIVEGLIGSTEDGDFHPKLVTANVVVTRHVQDSLLVVVAFQVNLHEIIPWQRT